MIRPVAIYEPTSKKIIDIFEWPTDGGKYIEIMRSYETELGTVLNVKWLKDWR